MGTNPSKSQQLQRMFPQFRVLPELTCQSSNIYELIFVVKERDLFIIKESENQYNYSRHPNTVTMVENKVVEKTYFSLYQWYSQSIQNFLKANPNQLNQGFAIFLMAATINVYGSFWKNKDGSFVDIRSQNIKVGKKNSGITIKVLPPSVTRKSTEYLYQNTINHLGQILKRIFHPKMNQFHPEISRMLEKMINNKSNTVEVWKKMEEQVLQIEINSRKSGFSPVPERRQVQNHSPISINYGSQRSMSPILPQNRVEVRINGQSRASYSPHSTHSPTYYSQRPISPVNIHPINTHQQPSKVTLHQHPQYFSRANKNQQENQIYQTQILDISSGSILKSPSSFLNYSEKPMKSPNSNQTFQKKDTSPRHLAELGNKTFQRENLNKNKNTSSEEKKNQKVMMNTALQVFPFFQPSHSDPLEMRPRLGVPNKSYTPKTKQDKSQKKDLEQNTHLNDDVLRTDSNFMKKHLLPSKGKQDLSESEIAVDAEKSSSFGLSVSEESQSGLYDGEFDGQYHPSHPNVRHGIGKLVLPSGGSYQGNFSWNRMDGWGKLFYPSGRLAYEGYWKKGKFEGYGKLFNENPQHIELFDYKDFNKIQEQDQQGFWKVYEGSMHSDMKQGHGIWILENGQKYEGEFKNDEVHGEGTFYGKKQNIEGVWENNKLVYIRKRE